VEAYRPFLWYQFNDDPAGLVVADSAVPNGHEPYPIGPPHPSPYPSTAISVPGKTIDGRKAISWTGSTDPVFFSLAGGQDFPNVGSIVMGRKRSQLGGKWELTLPSGNAVQHFGPANIIVNASDSYGYAIGTDYITGTQATVNTPHASVADGNWHLFGLNFDWTPNPLIHFRVYIDGVVIADFNINPNGLDYYTTNPNGLGIACSPGGGGGVEVDPANTVNNGYTLQDFMLFGAGYAYWGGPLGDADHLALFNAWI
jgi:hypothetical protein